jgi:hypothetical protein
MLGTIGWIVAGILVSKLLKSDTTALPMYVSAAAGLMLGVYAFTLPHVPPRGAGKKFSVRDVFGIDALKELGSRPFYVFLGGVLLISVPAGIYFPYVPVFLRDSGVACDPRPGTGAVRAHELRRGPAVRHVCGRSDLRARGHRSRRAGRASAVADVLAVPARIRVSCGPDVLVRLPGRSGDQACLKTARVSFL